MSHSSLPLWPLFGLYLTLGGLALFLTLPRPLNRAQFLVSLAALAVLTGGGLWLASAAGLPVTILANAPLKGEGLLRILGVKGLALAAGLALGVAILAAIRFFFASFLPQLTARFTAEMQLPLWKRIVIAFDSAVLEELAFRLLVFSAILWLAGRLLYPEGGLPPLGLLWGVNALIAIGFGLAHLPNWAAMTRLTPGVVAAVVLLNSAGGLLFGYLFFSSGLEAAVIAHFAADIVLHGVGPWFLQR